MCSAVHTVTVHFIPTFKPPHSCTCHPHVLQAVLESIRDLMNEDVIIPPWLHDIFLGYGDPGAAQWRSLPAEQRLTGIDFKDTFLDAQHVRKGGACLCV